VLTVRPPPPEEEWLGRLAAPDPLLDDPLMYSDLPDLPAAASPVGLAPVPAPTPPKQPARLMARGDSANGGGSGDANKLQHIAQQQQLSLMPAAQPKSGLSKGQFADPGEGSRKGGVGGDVSLWVSPHRPRGYRWVHTTEAWVQLCAATLLRCRSSSVSQCWPPSLP
jgi:hypothetical protein